jgi:release factor glutamine methyltransferase
MSLSIAEVILEASQILRKAGVPEPRREAGSLLAFVSGRDRTFLIAHAEHVLSESELNDFRLVVERRATGEPQQYITGVQDFFNREYKVTPDVLIPRPETELLVEAALQVIDPELEAKICDVGTGSGCIAVTLLCERRLACATALDISESALRIAKLNAQAHDVIDRITFLLSDCFDSVPSTSRFDLVVSNPPYVSAGALSGLQREVKDHEPLVALSPGDDGLVVIRRLLGDAPRFLKPGGHLMMEIGFDQSEKLRRMVEQGIWQLIDILPDLQGIPRIAVLQLI